ncbi:MAG: hypothetical protein ACR2IA_01055 [Pyrinomonadaceae bacterium]
MIRTVENRIGKTIYGTLQVSVLVLTLYTFKPDSPNMPDDLRTIGMLLLMGLLSFPISIIAAPLAFGLSFAIVGTFYLLVGQFTDIRNLSPYLSSAFIFLAWLGMCICGYLQWFGFPRRSDKRLR